MAARTRSAILAVLSLSSLMAGASATREYSKVEMLRVQRSLMDDRPKDCPPWYHLLLTFGHVASLLLHAHVSMLTDISS